jgi:hypothetical protein
MKGNRYRTIAVTIVVLALCTGLILGGCASTGKGKEVVSEEGSPQQATGQTTAAGQTSGSNGQVRTETVAFTGGAAGNASVPGTGETAGQRGVQRFATSLVQGVERLFSRELPELNWNRIGTILGGIVALSLVYGLAFGLARLPMRGGGAGRASISPQTAEPVGKGVHKEAA